MEFISKSKFVLLIATLLFLLVTGYFYRNIILSFRFVDEEYNFAIGRYLTKNEVLYDDIITNHQPITHILSGIIQKYAKPNTTYLLIDRHRTFIIIWSTIWALFLTAYFGWTAFLFVLIYELTKSQLLGNLFLAETLTTYPLVFLIGLTCFKKSKFAKWELILVGICLTLLTFLLGPIWPVLGLIIIILFYKQRNNLKFTLFYLALGILPIILLVFKYSSLLGYLKIYLYTNLTYTVPNYHTDYYHESWALTIFKAMITPVLSLSSEGTDPILWITKALSFLFIISLIYLIFKKKYLQAVVSFLLLGLTNIRFVWPGRGGYGGFHLLPWYASLIFISTAFFIKRLKVAYIILIVLALWASLIYAKSELFIKRDLSKDYEINYSTYTDLGQIIRIIRKPQDTLFVSRDAWLVYWQSDANHIPKLFGYYTWMAGIPYINDKVIQAFTTNPPTLIYCEDCLSSDLGQYLNQYAEVRRYGGKTGLYVLPERLKNLTHDQKDQLRFYGVESN